MVKTLTLSLFSYSYLFPSYYPVISLPIKYLCPNVRYYSTKTMNMKPLIVGVSGVTNGGKTTLSLRLQQEFPQSRLFKQDDYFYPVDSPHHVPCPGMINHHNWDIISSIDMDGMFSDVSQAIEQLSVISKEKNERSLIILDGFILFEDKRFRSLCDHQYFMTLSKCACRKRREKRCYDPPDPVGYFDQCVWPMYEKHLEKIQKIPSIKLIDGHQDIQITYDVVKNDIESMLSAI